jgi:ubiquinone/menaquinone biosynthesis C-methylase UbiE
LGDSLQCRFWIPAYDRFAWLYDAVDWLTANTTHRLRRRALRHLPPARSRVLEIGFGSGKLLLELAGQYDVVGLDRAPGMVRLAWRRLLARGAASKLLIGDVCSLPWPDGAFDAVLSTFAFSAFVDARRALGEMVRVTCTGGRVVIVDAGEASNGNLFARLLARAWESIGDYMRDEVPLMEAHGLVVTREECGPWGCVHVVSGVKPEQGG